MSQPGCWRVSDGTPVTAAEAREIWARAAHPLLAGVAHTYRAVITYKELAERIQESKGIRTRSLLQILNSAGKVNIHKEKARLQ